MQSQHVCVSCVHVHATVVPAADVSHPYGGVLCAQVCVLHTRQHLPTIEQYIYVGDSIKLELPLIRPLNRFVCVGVLVLPHLFLLQR